MGKVVINTCYGGFGLSDEACEWLLNHGFGDISENPEFDPNRPHNSLNRKYYLGYSFSRHDPLLIQCIEELGKEANGFSARLMVYEFNGDLYQIDEYDGMEYVRTPDTERWININN